MNDDKPKDPDDITTPGKGSVIPRDRTDLASAGDLRFRPNVGTGVRQVGTSYIGRKVAEARAAETRAITDLDQAMIEWAQKKEALAEAIERTRLLEEDPDILTERAQSKLAEERAERLVKQLENNARLAKLQAAAAEAEFELHVQEERHAAQREAWADPPKPQAEEAPQPKAETLPRLEALSRRYKEMSQSADGREELEDIARGIEALGEKANAKDLEKLDLARGYLAQSSMSREVDD